MLLQRLSEYADRLGLPPALYSETPIRYVIELADDGSFLGITDTADASDRATKRGVRRLAPEVQRSSAVKPLLLADKADYVLGLPKEETEASVKRAADCHAAFLKLLTRCVEATDEPSVRAVSTFLDNDPIARVTLPDDFDPGAKITFRVGEGMPIDLLSVQAFWAGENEPSEDLMQCVVCGEVRPVTRRLQAKIKGIPGGQTAGTSIISANSDAFQSYGLEASLVAPTCGDCGERFTKALNSLLSDRAHSYRIGGQVFAYWTRSPDEGFSILELLTKPTADDVRALLTSASKGRPPADIDVNVFYAATFSASGGRAVVRDWIETALEDAKRGIAHWFDRLCVVGPDGGPGEPLGLYALAKATVADSDEPSPPTTRALLRSALVGSLLPFALLQDAVRRNRAEQRVTRPRVALIKAVLAGRRNWKEERMVELEAGNRDPGYLCGRLLAVLEEIQRGAIPGAKATITDRFFGTASSAPASVFGRLVRGAQPHLAKLNRDRRGAYVALQKRMEEILSQLDGFPKVLTLEGQGLFALGYYHQRASDRAQAARNVSEKKAKRSVETEMDAAEQGAYESMLVVEEEE